jgi:1-acyl-sn-glycerol-3-phosphate acyltransferase
MARVMGVLRGDTLGDHLSGPDLPKASGWRVALNRFLWRAFILANGPLVVFLERVIPGRSIGYKLASVAAKTMLRTLGVRLEVRGLDRLDRSRGYVFCANHRSAMDIAVLLVGLPRPRFAAKVELFSDPAIGAPMRALGMIPIDRARPEIAKEALARAAAGSGAASVVFFPEGIVSPRTQMAPFKSGAFVFAIQTRMPIVPVAIHNSAGVMPDDPSIVILGGRVVVEILDPISVEGLGPDDRGPLKDRTQKAVTEALRPDDGGVASRPDLGAFRGHALGVRVS